jgi:hypothetical protein
MKKTLLAHFYNEEYLLPWWLQHHKQHFDHGILVDYYSTDNSRRIIKEICPDWEVRYSRNPRFDCIDCDAEIRDIELRTEGWKTTLNITEFLLGDYSILDDRPEHQYSITSYCMTDCADAEPVQQLSYDLPLYRQRVWGYNTFDYFPGIIGSLNNWDEVRAAQDRDWTGKFNRWGRSIHNTPTVSYPVDAGRHTFFVNTTDLFILWYGFSPDTDQMWRRKTQIGDKLSPRDTELSMGLHHRWQLDKLKTDMLLQRPHCADLTHMIDKYS